MGERLGKGENPNYIYINLKLKKMMNSPTPNERMLADAHKSKIHYSAMKVEAELRSDDYLQMVYSNIIDNCNKIIEICNRRIEKNNNARSAKIVIDSPIIDLQHEAIAYGSLADHLNRSK